VQGIRRSEIGEFMLSAQNTYNRKLDSAAELNIEAINERLRAVILKQ
jgi:hypothetical protein